MNTTNTRLAKCGKHSHSFCYGKHTAPECAYCTLIRRRPAKTLFREDGVYIYCSLCGKYKPKNEFRADKKGNYCWCMKCKHEYNQSYYRKNRPMFKLRFLEGEKIPLNYRDRNIVNLTIPQLIHILRSTIINNKELTIKISHHV